jgi:carbon-monoxide dehydrogenase iron sulfur subunit
VRLKVNYEKCAGCRACEMACSAKHYKKYSPELSRIRIVKFEDKGTDIPITCKQCIEAPCVNNCPVHALYKDEETMATLLKKDICIGCGICVEVCPFSAAALDENGLAMICDLCEGEPECVDVCPVKAIEVRNIEKTVEKKRIKVAEKHSENVLRKWKIK